MVDEHNDLTRTSFAPKYKILSINILLYLFYSAINLYNMLQVHIKPFPEHAPFQQNESDKTRANQRNALFMLSSVSQIILN